jgi:hypothetical protein
MKAEELRIGNWYQWYAEGKYYEYQVIQSDFSNDCNFLNFELIPLTKEWLIRFGFEYNYSFDLYSKSGFDIQLLENGIDFYLGEYGSYFTWIEYVHQLQNLYFALTGQELTIK